MAVFMMLMGFGIGVCVGWQYGVTNQMELSAQLLAGLIRKGELKREAINPDAILTILREVSHETLKP